MKQDHLILMKPAAAMIHDLFAKAGNKRLNGLSDLIWSDNDIWSDPS